MLNGRQSMYNCFQNICPLYKDIATTYVYQTGRNFKI